MTKFGDSLVVVTTLIATASFAAAFTVPGGFDGNEGSKQGMPILLRKAAYKALVVLNALAFSCSCCEGTGYIAALQYTLTGNAMVAMASAFITGTYVILAPSLAFAISLCATCKLVFERFGIGVKAEVRVKAVHLHQLRRGINIVSVLLE
ncbi:ankyrin repeat-containing protein [Artemisia annua]|uniref:Ankyrin repeat-containing protein n=1 Tax=Artemisia annua TaxID=35608 RepID=A0A2U1LY61_ARTAN|nr:ankyrin repeat-containing protein [Artemisia annua]